MKQNLEIKYRKIPLTNYLYEISEDGRYVRNAKSKKQCHVYKSIGDKWIAKLPGRGRYFEIDYLLQSVKIHPYLIIVKYPLSYTTYTNYFECIDEISMFLGLSKSTARDYLNQERKKIRMLEIIYVYV